MRPTSTYKMSKSLKRSLALGKFKSPEQRHAWKHAMIGAELAAKFVPKTGKNSQSTGNE